MTEKHPCVLGRLPTELSLTPFPENNVVLTLHNAKVGTIEGPLVWILYH